MKSNHPGRNLFRSRLDGRFELLASPTRELRVLTAAEGGAEHIGLDQLPHASAFIADWVAATFSELAAAR